MLFNNAGIQIPKAWDRMSEAEFDKVMAVNCDGVITATRVFWPMLVAADEAAVVNTSSVAAFLPNGGGQALPLPPPQRRAYLCACSAYTRCCGCKRVAYKH